VLRDDTFVMSLDAWKRHDPRHSERERERERERVRERCIYR